MIEKIKNKLKKKVIDEAMRDYKILHPLKFTVDKKIPDDFIITMTQKICDKNVDLNYDVDEFEIIEEDGKYTYIYKI